MAVVGHVDEISRAVVTGWVTDTERPNEAVSVSILVNGVHRGMCFATLSRPGLILPGGAAVPEACGFHFVFDPPLSPFVELRIDVVETWSAKAVLNGSLILPRPRSSHDDGARIAPILVTSTGRTGTTLLMSEFARHPDTVVGDQFPYEIKQIGYYAAAFRALAADANREHSTTPDTMLGQEMQHIIGANPYNMAGLFSLGGTTRALRDFYQSTLPSRYATLFRQFILEFYTTLAAAQGKQFAPYFCEKGDIDEAAVQGARLFFDTVKDIVIVRDPRDLLCSAISFWKLQPNEAMKMLANTIPRLARIAREAGPDTIVIRYEDLVREPLGTRQALSRFLGLDLLSRAAAGSDPIPDSHRTSRDPAASIGRWRNDLMPDQAEACEVAFWPYMRDFGYESSAGPGTRHRPETPGIVAAEGAVAVDGFADAATLEDKGSAWRRTLALEFGAEGTGHAFTLEGWSRPEPGFVWSDAPRSMLRLPPIRREGEYLLHITASPFTHGAALPAQRVTVLLDGRPAGTALVRDICILSIPIPPTPPEANEPITLTLCFPDAARPCELFETGDDRKLGFSLHRIVLFRLEAASDSALSGPGLLGCESSVPAGRDPVRRAHGDERLIAHATELSREAFKQPKLEYYSHTGLRDIAGYDDARFIQLIMALEAEFNIVLLEHEVDRIATMEDVVALLRSKVLDGG
jgi:hypothetical protein